MKGEAAFTLHLALALLAALVFARAALHKLRDGPAFREALEAYRLLPSWSLAGLALALPLAEIALAVTLPLPLAHPWAASGAAALLSLYAVAVAINLARGRDHIDCGCAGGRAGAPIGPGLMARNLAFAALLVLAAATPFGAAGLAGGVVAVAAAVTAFGLWLCQETFAALPRPDRAAPRIGLEAAGAGS